MAFGFINRAFAALSSGRRGSTQSGHSDSTTATATAKDGQAATGAAAAAAEAQDGLKRQINARQMVFMALSSSIGAGLLVASGQALHNAGPGNMVLGFAAVGFGVVCTMAALGEMAATLPLSGSFYTYTHRFVGPAAGFAMAWNFAFNWLIILPFEIVTISAQVRLWDTTGAAHPALVMAGFLAFVSLVSMMGSRWFSEAENFLGGLKIIAIAIFICLALSLTTTGRPYVADRAMTLPPGRIAYGTTWWQRPGAFLHGFQGFLTVFKIAGMAYGGTETLGLTAAECLRPARLMRIATYVTFVRIFLFYLVGLTMLGFLLPSDAKELTPSGGGANPSPFVLAMRLAGLTAVEHIISACIVAALTSMANVAIFASSRALHALSSKGMAPKFLSRTTRGGVPLPATVVAICFGLLAFVGAAPGGRVIFFWLLSLAGMSNYFTWLAICISHVRFRAALRHNGRAVSSLSFASPFGTWGSWVGIATSLVGLCSQIAMAFWPLTPGQPINTKDVLMDVTGAPAILILFAAYWIYQRRTGRDSRILRPVAEIDVDTGFRGRAEVEREKEELSAAEAAATGSTQAPRLSS
ncbi:hypothetical protein GGTG_00117 [Gaeumannomyces tritici R3-111a-1]|uniref:Amino acid permease/ SLC12A domain-containing protein n=1 Tax=Gaeumannomyces tritici (strain R3-111a-1) TaxID=644352 RepID=J3NFS3_GAET3|nr:hypothetical protein GGTG_00117 [Gaeumannomyces tritici R3-111a-1]EJT80113.1 hypothetical protein GGTG_00117 [Gaeumannomyces tritici R3-111a-1]